MLATLAPVLSGVGVAPVNNSYFSIATQTVGLSGAASITFSSIPSTYTHLQIRASANNANQDDAVIRFNGDTGNNYSWHLLQGNGSAASAYSATSVSSMRGICYLPNSSNNFGAGVTDILNYTNVNKNKTTRSLTGFDLNANSTFAQIQFWSGAWYNTSAITSITIFPLSGSNFVQYSTFALYGVK
jgi:hypothetical protein